MRLDRLLQRGTASRHDGVAAEPSEVRYRNGFLAVAIVAGPLLLLALYFRAMFPGLTNPDALDYAQLGRNLGNGHGFSTYVLRPLALSHGANPLRQPDLTHGPLYPLFLALAFGLFGARDLVVAGVSGLFYLLTLPVIYRLGSKCFNPTIGLLATLIFMGNAVVLEYAASGLPITLCVFLATSLFLTLHAVAAEDPVAEHASKGRLALVGLLASALYLTDPRFFWVLPGALGAVIWLAARGRRAVSGAWFMAPVVLLALPWMVRNGVLTGDPIFGLRGLEVWMNTPIYPGYYAYRLGPTEVSPGVALLRAVVKKAMFNTDSFIQTIPQIPAVWALLFFVPGLFFRFRDPAANRLRRLAVLFFVGTFAGLALFHIEMPMFITVVPVLLVFAVAYLQFLMQQAQLTGPARATAISLLIVGLAFPLVNDLVLADRPDPLGEADTAAVLSRSTRPDEISLSDEPWVVAWFADRPSLWIPAVDQSVRRVRRQFPNARWLFLSEGVRGFSPEWASIYNVFQQWNSVYVQARAANKATPEAIKLGGHDLPLFEALDGFTTVGPTGASPPAAVLAFLPQTRQTLSMARAPDSF